MRIEPQEVDMDLPFQLKTFYVLPFQPINWKQIGVCGCVRGKYGASFKAEDFWPPAVLYAEELD